MPAFDNQTVRESNRNYISPETMMPKNIGTTLPKMKERCIFVRQVWQFGLMLTEGHAGFISRD